MDNGVAFGPGCQPSASAAAASSQNGIPNADELRNQVVAQCKAVEHLAHAVARLHSDYALMVATGGGIIDMVGPRTAWLMETLGDFLNGVDAVSEEDEWLTPIFEAAHRLYPSASAIDAAAAGETRSGSTEGESAAPNGGDAHE